MQLVFSNNNKLENNICNLKDEIPTLQKSGIYQISCGECDKVYIGQTRRSIHTRFKEHIAHIKYNRASKFSLAHHAIHCNHNNIPTENLTLRKSVKDPYQTNSCLGKSLHKQKQTTTIEFRRRTDHLSSI